MKKITWNTVELLCDKLGQQIKQCDISYDGIYGISRGGLVPATILSHILNLPILTERELLIKLDEQSGDFLANSKRFLIVDEINDTGTTLSKYEGCDAVSTIVLYERESSVFPADFVGEVILNEEWLNFPWERQTKATQDQIEFKEKRNAIY